MALSSVLVLLQLISMVSSISAKALSSLPDILLDQASVDVDTSGKLKAVLESGSSISPQLCDEAGLVCAAEAKAILKEHNGEFDEEALQFFTLKRLEAGEVIVLPPLMHTQLPRKFLPLKLESTFQNMEFAQVLKTFGTPANSSLAATIREAMHGCADEGLEHEIKKCISSLASMLQFTASLTKASLQHLKYLVPPREKTSYENVKVISHRVVADKEIVTCHGMMFTYALYMCHTLPKTVALEVTLEDSHGQIVKTPAICHMDTSTFDPSHVGFKILHSKPGDQEMCHWSPDSIIWYTKEAITEA